MSAHASCPVSAVRQRVSAIALNRSASLAVRISLLAMLAMLPSVCPASRLSFGNELGNIPPVLQVPHNASAPQVCLFQMSQIGGISMLDKVSVVMPVQRRSVFNRLSKMLAKMHTRFSQSGFATLQFFIIQSLGYVDDLTTTTPSNGEDEDASPPPEAEASLATRFVFERTINESVVVLHELPSSGNPQRAFAPGSASVFDKCGRFAYIVFSPWSNLQRPYLKASILSTMFDAPCGQCSLATPSPQPMSSTEASSSDRTSVENIAAPIVSSTSAASTESATTHESAASLAIRVIAPIAHAHRLIGNVAWPTQRFGAETTPDEFGSANEYYTKYNYIVFHSNDPDYHGHLPGDRAERLAVVSSGRDDGTSSVDLDRSTSEASSSIVDTSGRSALHFITDYGKHFVSTPMLLQRQQSESSAAAADGQQQQIRVTSGSDQQTQNQFARDYVNLAVIPWPVAGKKRSSTGRMVTNNYAADETKPKYYESNDLNRHYSRIAEWIQFKLHAFARPSRSIPGPSTESSAATPDEW